MSLEDLTHHLRIMMRIVASNAAHVVVICPTCCCGRTNHGVYEDEHGIAEKGPGLSVVVCSPLVAIAELLTTIFLALSCMLFEESQDFKNTHRMTRHLAWRCA